MPQTRQCGCWCIGLSALCSLASWLVWSTGVGLLPCPRGLDPPSACTAYCTSYFSEQSMMGHGSVWTRKTRDKLSPVTPLFFFFFKYEVLFKSTLTIELLVVLLVPTVSPILGLSSWRFYDYRKSPFRLSHPLCHTCTLTKAVWLLASNGLAAWSGNYASFFWDIR